MRHFYLEFGSGILRIQSLESHLHGTTGLVQKVAQRATEIQPAVDAITWDGGRGYGLKRKVWNLRSIKPELNLKTIIPQALT